MEPEKTSQVLGVQPLETPLEQAAREEALGQTGAGQDARDEREADVLVSDIDAYIAETDPASLTEAEAQLEAWQIPNDPLVGDADRMLGVDGQPLVVVCSAQSESEANIIQGLLEAEGIPATLHIVATPVYGSIFSSGEARWGDVLVASSRVDEARAAIAAAQTPARADKGEPYHL